jgi:hypothetical protein
MNADHTRRGEMAELARLLPVPAERELPAGRLLTLKEHLMSELRIADSAAAGTPPARRRRGKRTIALAGVLALAAVAAGLVYLTRPTAGISPAAVRLLDNVATMASRQPVPAVRDNQFWYIRSWVAYESCDGGTGKCVLEKPHERQVWQSVSNHCVTGLLREYGQNTPLTFSTNIPGLKCPYRGDLNDPTYRLLQSLPTDPHALLRLIYREMQGQQPAPEEAFTTIGDMIGEAIAPPQVSAALYRAAALIPGVTVVPDATDAIGRHGVGVAMTSQGVRMEWVFSRQTFRYLGEHDINVADGSTNGEAAILQRAFVDRVGQIPG